MLNIKKSMNSTKIVKKGKLCISACLTYDFVIKHQDIISCKETVQDCWYL